MDDERPEAPADRLRARAGAVDREARFAQRLAEVERVRGRRRAVRRIVRVGWALAFAGLGGLVPIVVAAVGGLADPAPAQLLVAAGVGLVVGAVGPTARNALARRRGARAWDAYNERYVLLGDPSRQVRDADRPRPTRGGPPPPGR